MAIFYYAPTRSFFNTVIHSFKNIPVDAVEISQDLHCLLLAGEAGGKLIQIDETGQPVLVDKEEDPEAMSAAERAWRSTEINRVSWLRDRHRDEIETGTETTIDAEQYAQLHQYIQALRDWPDAAAFPDTTHRPVTPMWLSTSR